MDITELLAFSAKQGASDLHLSAGLPPMIRVDGDVRRINLPPMEHKQVHSLIYEIMNDKQRKDFEEFLETDFSFEVPGVARFRVNSFNQNRGAGAVFRTIPSKVLTMEDLDFTIRDGSGTYSKLDKEYNNYINKTLRELDEDKGNRWDIYNLIMNELITLGLHTVFEEVKYRLTDGEEPNHIMLDVITREGKLSELSWFLKNRIEEYIEEDFYNRFY